MTALKMANRSLVLHNLCVWCICLSGEGVKENVGASALSWEPAKRVQCVLSFPYSSHTCRMEGVCFGELLCLMERE